VRLTEFHWQAQAVNVAVGIAGRARLSQRSETKTCGTAVLGRDALRK
jgi:hypothetical protein